MSGVDFCREKIASICDNNQRDVKAGVLITNTNHVVTACEQVEADVQETVRPRGVRIQTSGSPQALHGRATRAR